MCSVPSHSEKLTALLSTNKIGVLEKEGQDFNFLNLGLQALYLEVSLNTYIYKGTTLF